MANKKITELTVTTTLTGSEVSEVVQGGVNKQITKANEKTFYTTDLPDPTNPQDPATKAFAESLVVGLWDDRGNFDASVNAYPSSGGSGTAGAILKGDIWTVSVGGTLPTAQVVNPGDTVRALVNTPGNTQANWAIAENNIGYVPENQANKENTTLDTSTTKYPTNRLVKEYVDNSTPDNASETVKGIVEEATDAEVAAGTAEGGTGARLFLNPAKLLTWWTSIKAAAQTIAGFWTFGKVKTTHTAFGYAILTDAANIAWNADTVGNIAQVTLGGNRTLDAITNPQTGAIYIIRVVQDGTGSRTLSFNAAFTFPNSITPILNSAISAVTVYAFFYDGTNFRYILPNGSYRFLDAYLESQKAASAKKNDLIIDDAGKINKVSWIEYDTTNNKVTITGINDSSGTTTFEVLNQSLNYILRVLNGRAIQIGGTTFAIIVDDAIASGSAYIELNSNQNQPFKIVDKAGNVYEEIRSTTSDLAKRINQPLEVNQLSGDAISIYKQFQATVTATAAGTTTIGFIGLINEQFLDVVTQWIVAEPSGVGGGCNINGTCRRDSGGTVALVGSQDKSAERRTSGDWLCDLIADDTNKRLNLRFTNNTGTGLTFKVTVNVWYTKILEPA